MTDLSPISTARTALRPSAPRRHLRSLTRRDRVVLGVMIGIPTLIQLILVWMPLLASIVLSFFKWDGLGLSGFHFEGLTNYNFVFNQAPAFWPAVLHNIVWLLFLGIIGTPSGCCSPCCSTRRSAAAASTRPCSSCPSCCRSR
ncbi:hypothetical protein [Amnibacterium kyonggiense]